MGRTGHRPHKRKFHGNQHSETSTESAKCDIKNLDVTVEESPCDQSASEREIKLEVKEEEREEKIGGSSLTGYRLIDMATLKVKFFFWWPSGDQLFRFSRQRIFLGAKIYVNNKV